jgi:hypothetical protein
MFVNDINFIHFVPIALKSDAGDALLEHFEDKGVPTSCILMVL